jgi:F0F1-type ATP synthase epsilon subunit
MMNLNFSMPHGAIYEDTPCALVRVPGAAGEFGITAGHVPIIAELQAGTVLVYPEKEGTPEEYFVSGGFAMYHENGNCDVAVVEAFKLEDLDADAVAKGLASSKSTFDSAPQESVEKGIAEVEMNTFSAMQKALEG